MGASEKSAIFLTNSNNLDVNTPTPASVTATGEITEAMKASGAAKWAKFVETKTLRGATLIFVIQIEINAQQQQTHK